MALNKENRNYHYNLGRTVALVEIINNLPHTFAGLVFDNANEKLPYQLNEALKRNSHNLHKELIEPADVVLNQGELPSKVMTAVDPFGKYWIGYYHQKSYLADTYQGVFGKVETEVTEHVPERIDFSPEGVNAEGKDNIIEELRK